MSDIQSLDEGLQISDEKKVSKRLKKSEKKFGGKEKISTFAIPNENGVPERTVQEIGKTGHPEEFGRR